MKRDIGVTAKTLIDTLEEAHYCVSIDDDGDIYVEEGFNYPLWITLDAEQQRISIKSAIPFSQVEAIDTAAANTLVNEINRRYVPNSVHHDEGALWATYTIYFYDGLSGNAFIRLLRRSANSLDAAVRDCDTKRLCVT